MVSHLSSGRFPFPGQTLEDFGGGGLKAPAGPKRRLFLRPNPEHAVMGGDGLDAFPEQLPRGVGHGKIRVTLAVKQGMRAGDLQRRSRR